jgi:hypothetical protein
MAHMMHHWISGVDYTLCDCYPQCLNADRLPPSFKLDHADGVFLPELLLFIQGIALYRSLQLSYNPLILSHTPGCCLCLSIGLGNQKVQSHVGVHICSPVSLVFGCSVP